MNVNIKEEYENLNVSSGQIIYAQRVQKLLCERLNMELPSEYELSEIVVEQALFTYIDIMEQYYRLDGKPWEEFYEKYHGVTDVPRRLEEVRKLRKGSLGLLEKDTKSSVGLERILRQKKLRNVLKQTGALTE